MKRAFYISIAAAALSAALGASAFTQEMGVFSVDRKARASFTASGMGLTYSVKMADGASVDRLKEADADGNGEIDSTEKQIFFIGLARQVREGLRLSLDREAADLKLGSIQGEFPLNPQGRKTIKAELVFSVKFPENWKGGAITLVDAVFSSEVGARQMVVDPPPGWELSTQDGRLEGTSYIFDGPKGVGPWSVRFDIKPPGQTGAAEPKTETGASDRIKKFNALIEGNKRLLALLAAIFALLVGMAHSLMPGHGKELLPAYLVGERGTLRHAALFGWMVTAVRTTPVFSVGVVTLLLDLYLPAGKWKWYLHFLSALAVGLIGLSVFLWNLLVKIGREYRVPTGLSSTEVVAMALTGNVVPSPSALALLFCAVSMGYAMLGLGLVVAFGFGLEGMMTIFGFFAVKAPSVADFMDEIGEKLRRVPVLWGIVLLGAGTALIFYLLQFR